MLIEWRSPSSDELTLSLLFDRQEQLRPVANHYLVKNKKHCNMGLPDRQQSKKEDLSEASP